MVKAKEPKKVKKTAKKIPAPKKVAKVKAEKIKEIKKAAAIPEKVKEEKISPQKEEARNPSTSEAKRRYFYALGRRKTSIAQVKIYSSLGKEGEFKVNGKDLVQYLTIKRFQTAALSPLTCLGLEGKFDISIKVFGGGINGQADAIKLGIARALVVKDESLRKALKDNGFLTRDSRKVERKKPGLKKARRAPQWAKR
jgi:small subunit ribosomal protein S9